MFILLFYIFFCVFRAVILLIHWFYTFSLFIQLWEACITQMFWQLSDGDAGSIHTVHLQTSLHVPQMHHCNIYHHVYVRVSRCIFDQNMIFNIQQMEVKMVGVVILKVQSEQSVCSSSTEEKRKLLVWCNKIDRGIFWRIKQQQAREINGNIVHSFSSLRLWGTIYRPCRRKKHSSPTCTHPWDKCNNKNNYLKRTECDP